MEHPDALNEAAMAWSAWRGYRTYQATGDTRSGVNMGLRTYGCYWMIGNGICWTLIGAGMAFMAPGFLVLWVLSIPALVYGIYDWKRTNERYHAITSGAIHRTPPPIPGVPVVTTQARPVGSHPGWAALQELPKAE